MSDWRAELDKVKVKESEQSAVNSEPAKVDVSVDRSVNDLVPVNFVTKDKKRRPVFSFLKGTKDD